ncbi:lysosomal Pro-X carboxypeptidase [Rhipicephalus sanguineus]|uniref:lysosomal Pro-X carboxypeptidase n=1 Tax=Rhipicephalus sanguineus TaxID=34632 RepID=UPI001896022B|nr:lysosomal Pro-X carboxypeptidase [Rhipicephalus sanguineus]
MTMNALLRTVVGLCALLSAPGAAVDTSYKEYKFRTKLDHFAFHNNKTFEIRYAMADQYWDHDGGPIFFYTGNEDEVENFITNTGIMWEWAPEFNALIVFAEHRFYGQSLPFGNKSYESPHHLGYLTSEQAMADYADLILHLKYTLPGAEKSAVVAFGGSYGGMLAAWFRVKYPHIVTASLAASAPINMSPGLVPCGKFNEAVTAAYERESELCSAAIRKSWTELQKLGYSVAGCKQLRQKFGLCQSLHPTNYTLLRDWLKEIYGTIALVNFPEPSDLVGAVPGNPVRVACEGFLKAPENNRSALIDAVARAVNVLFNSTGQRKCHDLFIYQRNLAGYNFQKCNELMTATCGNGVTDMFFPYTWNATAELERCKKQFGITPDFYRTIMLYGGDRFDTASNIIFSNGELDPWSALGVVEPLSNDVVVLNIPGAAHHVDLRFSRSSDSPEVVRARQIEKTYIRRWIAEADESPERSRKEVLVSRIAERKKQRRKTLIKHLLFRFPDGN